MQAEQRVAVSMRGQPQAPEDHKAASLAALWLTPPQLPKAQPSRLAGTQLPRLPEAHAIAIARGSCRRECQRLTPPRSPEAQPL